MKKVLGVTKFNFRYTKIAWLTFAICFVAQGISEFTNIMISLNKGELSKYENTGLSWFFVLYAIMVAVTIPAKNYYKFMNLNVKKTNYLKGTALFYIIVAVAVSVLIEFFRLTVDSFILSTRIGFVYNMTYVFGWGMDSVITILLRQFAFVLLLICFINMMVSIQGFWYGWATDIFLAAIISVFTPIAPLRNVLIWFFNIIIFNSNALMQIIVDIVLAAIFYVLSVFATKQRRI